MQLSPNQKTFSQFFSAFAASTSNLQYFEEEGQPQRFFGCEIIDWKKRGYLNA